jgi:hypothetical protein
MKIPVVCASCGKLIRHIELGYDAPPDAVSHGLCQEHADEILAAYKEVGDGVGNA